MNKSISRSDTYLSPRDQAILTRIAEHRYLTSRHVERFFFTHHRSAASAGRSCRRVLARLFEQRFIVRMSIRTVGGWAAGSTGYTYRLARRGYMALMLQPRTVVARSPLFLEHTLAIADVRLALNQMANTGKLQLVEVTTEPANWISYASFGEPQILKPDLFVVTAASPRSAYENCWFIELDRGTMSANVVLQKCQQYMSYQLSSQARVRHEGFPVILWLVPSKRRQSELQRIIIKMPTSQQRMFRVLLRSRFTAYLCGYYFLGRVALHTTSTTWFAMQKPANSRS